MLYYSHSKARLFPACAGVIPGMLWGGKVSISFPRVCGGDPQILNKD